LPTDQTEGSYTHATFTQDLSGSNQNRSTARIFGLTDLAGDDIRTIYYAIREYKDKILKDLVERRDEKAAGFETGSGFEGKNESNSLEEEIFLSLYLHRLACWQADLEERFGSVDNLSFG
jgi:hypothetical protein